MAHQLVLFQTSDGLFVSYPLRPLRKRCDLIKGLFEDDSNRDPVIELRYSSQELEWFFTLLETGSIDGGDLKHMDAALRVADFMGLNLSEMRLAKLLEELDVDHKGEEFLKTAGYKELSIPALQHLINNRNELESFVVVPILARYWATVEALCDRPTQKGHEIVDALVELLPPIFRLTSKKFCHDFAVGMFKDYDVPMSLVKNAIVTLKNTFMRPAEPAAEPAAEGPQVGDGLLQQMGDARAQPQIDMGQAFQEFVRAQPQIDAGQAFQEFVRARQQLLEEVGVVVPRAQRQPRVRRIPEVAPDEESDDE